MGQSLTATTVGVGGRRHRGSGVRRRETASRQRCASEERSRSGTVLHGDDDGSEERRRNGAEIMAVVGVAAKILSRRKWVGKNG